MGIIHSETNNTQLKDIIVTDTAILRPTVLLRAMERPLAIVNQGSAQAEKCINCVMYELPEINHSAKDRRCVVLQTEIERIRKITDHSYSLVFLLKR